MSLEDLPGIGPRTAEKLREVGYIDLMSIAAASPMELSSAAEIGDTTAVKAIAAAQAQLDMGFETATQLLEKRKSIGVINLPSESLSNLLGGGVQTQAITEVHGPYASGKTQCAFVLTAMVQKPKEEGGLDAEACYIDTENTFRPNRVKQIAESIGLDPDEAMERIHVARAYNSDHQMLLSEKIDHIIDNGSDIRLVVVDSLTAHFRAEYTGRGTLANRQQKLNRHLHRLQKLADVHNLAIFVTNQVMAKPDNFFGPSMEAIGGHILAHAATYRVYLRKGKGGTRVAKLIDSPDLPEGEAAFRITEGGVEDA